MQTLVDLLAGRCDTATLTAADWDGVLTVARAEALLGTLAHRLAKASLPAAVAQIFDDQRAASSLATTQALWEGEMARRALAPAGVEFILLKGTAYAAAGLRCAEGRQIGDLDILVGRYALARAENALLASGWEWVKADDYDDAYYRQYMHELPPLIHKQRDRMIDVHHTILPLTHRITPNAPALISEAVPLSFRDWISGLGRPGRHPAADPGATGGVAKREAPGVLNPADMVCHCAAHLLADGELQGGLRNLWDFHCLVVEFLEEDSDFHLHLMEEAWCHGLSIEVNRALRLANRLFGTPLKTYSAPLHIEYRRVWSDQYYIRRLMARDDWGRSTRPLLHLCFYVRSHWLRMPPMMLARHLWTKWRKV